MRSRTTKYAPFCGRGFFAHLIQMTASDYGRRERASWSTMSSLSKTEPRAAQPNLHRGRIFAHACKSRRAPRPRKPDGKLNRHGLGARRVALLAPRGVLGKYRYPLSYVGAITKNFGKAQKQVPHFGRRVLYSEWGRSPGGEEGVCHSHVRGRQLIFFYEHDEHHGRASPNTPTTPREHPRDEKFIRSVLEHDEHSKRVQFWRVIKQLKRGAGDRSARVLILT